MNNRIVLACVAWAVIAGGCGTTSGDDTAEAGGSGGDVPTECEVVGPVEGEIQCGTYVLRECEPEGTEPGATDDGGGTAGGGDTGAGDTGAGETGGGDTGSGASEGGEVDPCQEQVDANQAVLQCVLDTTDAGLPLVFSIRDDDVAIVVTHTYHVAADGAMWRSYDGAIDLCQESSTTVHGPVSLGPCDDWDCVQTTVQSAPVVATCEQQESCLDG